MKRISCGAALAVCTGISILGAGAAQADDESYLGALNVKAPYWAAPYVEKLQAGHQICDELHAGSTPQKIYASHNYPARIFRWPLIESAQNELCPETLPGAGHR